MGITRRITIILIVLCGFAPGLHAEILDRIVAVVDEKIITLSDIRKEQQILTLLGEGSTSEQTVLQTLIDRYLVEDQIAQFSGIDVSDQEIQQRMPAIPSLGTLTMDDIRATVARRIRRAKFFDQRFRQFISVTDEETRQYYENVFVPEAQRRGLNPIPPFEEVIDSIRINVSDEKLSGEVEVWLETIRRRSDVEVFP